MNRPRVIGIDPGFASIGYAEVVIGKRPEEDIVTRIGVIRTAKADTKRKVYAADDNIRRCREIVTELEAILSKSLGNKCICAESMSFPRNASAAAQVALTWGIITTLAEARKMPILQCSPQELKMVVVGSKSASKTEIQAVLDVKYPNVRGILLAAKVPNGQLEHAYDALGAIEACSTSTEFRLLRGMS